jgi:hypothetical protein
MNIQRCTLTLARLWLHSCTTKKDPVKRQGLSGLNLCCRSDGLYIICTWTFLALTRLKIDLLAVIE